MSTIENGLSSYHLVRGLNLEIINFNTLLTVFPFVFLTVFGAHGLD